jgi:transmembrane sensor
MNKSHFNQLLTRYLNGECSPREEKLVQQWFALIDHDDPAGVATSDVEKRLWQAIQERTSLPKTPEKSLHLLLKWQWAAAAAILILMVWGGYHWTRNRAGDQDRFMAGNLTSDYVTATNETAAPKLVRLSDGSRVNLQPQSAIRYKAAFGNREIYLQGKAFFEVTRDERRPFKVYAGEITTKVLGTSFWVDHQNAGHDVEVSVVTGTVSVSKKSREEQAAAGDQASGVILSRNQMARYTQQSKTFTTTLASNPVLDETYRKAFVFDDSSLARVVHILEKAYGIDIVFENEKLKNCLFTADITGQPFLTQLDLVTSSVNATYVVRGTKVYVKGSGCRK